jgi:hypothetical protein
MEIAKAEISSHGLRAMARTILDFDSSIIGTSEFRSVALHL